MSGKTLERRGRLPSPDSLSELLGTPLGVATLQHVQPEQIVVRPGFNPRTAHLSEEVHALTLSRDSLADLTSSMLERLSDGKPRGVQQPLLVRPLGGQVFELVAGERRLQAARFAKLERIPVLVRELSDTEALAAAIIENAQRRNLDVVAETYSGFTLLSELTGLNQGALISHLNALRQSKVEDTHGLERMLRLLYGTGVSTWSQQRARILKLTPLEQQAISSGQLEVKAAFELLRLPNEESRSEVLRTLLAADPRLDRLAVSQLVNDYLQQHTTELVQQARSLSKLAGKLRRLQGKEATEALRLMSELRALVSG